MLKQALLRTDQGRIEGKRRRLWLAYLNVSPEFVLGSYQESLAAVPSSLAKGTAEAISVDVKRSFNQNKEVSHESLSNVLSSYALVNPKLNYCQGMNFMVGFLLMSFEHEEHIAFGVLKEIVERYQMSHLFNPELPQMKMMFYQMDRLICLNLPDLHQHFKVSAPADPACRTRASTPASSARPSSSPFSRAPSTSSGRPSTRGSSAASGTTSSS